MAISDEMIVPSICNKDEVVYVAISNNNNSDILIKVVVVELM